MEKMIDRLSITDNETKLIEKLIDKLDGEQITRIAITIIKVAGLCALSYMSGQDGSKLAFNQMANTEANIIP